MGSLYEGSYCFGSMASVSDLWQLPFGVVCSPLRKQDSERATSLPNAGSRRKLKTTQTKSP